MASATEIGDSLAVSCSQPFGFPPLFAIPGVRARLAFGHTDVQPKGCPLPRRILLDPSGRSLLIRFRFDPALIDTVKSIAGRRWDGQAKQWTVPATAASEALAKLLPLGFVAAAEVHQLCGSSALTRPVVTRTVDSEQAERLVQSSLNPKPSAYRAREDVGDNPSPPFAEWPRTVMEARTPLPTAPSAPSAAPQELPQELAARAGCAQQPEATQSWSVARLNLFVRNALRERFPRDIWLVAEILGLDRASRGGQSFFELVEKPQDSDAVRARVSATLWPDDRARIEYRIRNADDPFALEDGLTVRLKVSVELYVPNGRYQVIVRDIDPVYTLGNLALKRESIIKELDRRNLLGRNRALQMPLVPLHVALLTSLEGEARNDFLHELQSAPWAFVVDVYPIKVQGKHLVATFTRALDRVRRHVERGARTYDVVVITRGGGSRTDLAWFDDLPVAIQVAEFPLKIVIGIGHQRDQSVLDQVATSVKTPTAAASLLNDRVSAYASELETHITKISSRASANHTRARQALRITAQGVTTALRALLAQRRARYEYLQERVTQSALHLLRGQRTLLDRASMQIVERSRSHLRLQSRELDTLQLRILSEGRVRTILARERRSVAELEKRLTRTASRPLEESRRALDAIDARVALSDPKRLLERGFAWVSTKADGRTLRSIHKVRSGDLLQVELADGTLLAVVESVNDERQ